MNDDQGYKMNERFVELMESWMVIKDLSKDVLQKFMLRVGTRFFTHNATQLNNFKAGCGLLACYVEMRADKFRKWWIEAGQCPIEKKKDNELLNVQGGGDIHDWRFELRDVENPFNEPPGVHKQGSKPFRGRAISADSPSDPDSDGAQRGSDRTGAAKPEPPSPTATHDLGQPIQMPRYTQEAVSAFTVRDGKAGKGNDFLEVQRFRNGKAGKGNDRGEEESLRPRGKPGGKGNDRGEEESLRPRGKLGGKGTHRGREPTRATSPWGRTGSEKKGKGKDRGWEEELRRSGRKSIYDGKGKDRTLRYYSKGHTHPTGPPISSTPDVVADARALFADALEASSQRVNYILERQYQ